MNNETNTFDFGTYDNEVITESNTDNEIISYDCGTY